jgi:hypothetical protein
MTRFKQDPAAQKALSQTAKLADMKSGDFDTILYVGGQEPRRLLRNPKSVSGQRNKA